METEDLFAGFCIIDRGSGDALALATATEIMDIFEDCGMSHPENVEFFAIVFLHKDKFKKPHFISLKELVGVDEKEDCNDFDIIFDLAATEEEEWREEDDETDDETPGNVGYTDED
jgi:hypothetical protein